MNASRHFLRRWWAVGLTWAGIVLGFVGQHLFREIEERWRYLWLALGLLGAGVAATMVAIQRIRADRALDEAKAELLVTMVDALDPLMESLGQLVTCPEADRAVAARALTEKALTAASQILGAKRTRASYFEVQMDEPRRVVPAGSIGRAGRPRTTFRSGTVAGDYVLGMLERDEHFFCHDTATSAPPGWDASRDRSYRTFLTVPARAGDLVAGMVTVDAPTPGDLAEEDRAFLRVIGTIIAAADLIANPPFFDEETFEC